MSKYIASTLSASVQYTGYRTSGGNDMPVVDHAVTIAGGANVADARIVTPRGVITAVSDEDAAWLENHEVFKLHKANGFVQVLESEPRNPDDAAADMRTRDESAPLVDEDYEGSAVGAPTHSGKRRR